MPTKASANRSSADHVVFPYPSRILVLHPLGHTYVYVLHTLSMFQTRLLQPPRTGLLRREQSLAENQKTTRPR